MAIRLLSNALYSASTLGTFTSNTHKFSKAFATRQIFNVNFAMPKLAGLNQEISENANRDLARTLDFHAIKIPHSLMGTTNITVELITKKNFPHQQLPFEEGLYRRGLRGLTYIKEGRIKELLIEIRSEKDPAFRIEWLKETLKIYPFSLLYLELFRYLCLEIFMAKDNEIRKSLCIQAVAYHKVGSNLAEVDCIISGVSFKENFQVPDSVYESIYGDDESEKNVIEFINKEYTHLLKNLKNLPSPIWVSENAKIEFSHNGNLEEQRKKILESVFTKREVFGRFSGSL